MQCRILSVGHSAWPVRLAVVCTAFAFICAGSVGTAVPWWLQCSWLPVLYSCYSAAEFWQPSWMLNLGDGLQLRYYDATSSQPRLELSGALLPESLLCWLGIWLCWRTESGNIARRWLFHDAMPEADFRRLARHVRQRRWQQPAPAAGLLQWFR